VKQQVLVTGGAGFVGSHVVDALVADGHGVRVLDSLDEHAHGATPAYLNPEAEYIWSDLADAALLDRCLEGATAVSHQAAMVGMGVDFDDAVDYVRHNALGTATLLRTLHRRRFGGRLVLASSMVVYGEGDYRCPRDGLVRPCPRSEGDLRRGMFEPSCPRCGARLEASSVVESSTLDPRSVYAATKLHQEHLCFAFGRSDNVAVAALRYHNIYGPRMPRDTPYAGVASVFRSALERGRPPSVFEDGRQRRDFVHVRDVADANVIALTRDEPAAGPFNIASGVPHTVGEMAEALARAFGPGAPTPRVCGSFRTEDVRHVFASAGLAASRLGFRAKVQFEDGMREFARSPLRAAARAPAHGLTSTTTR
jgi:dTDP-L-rhamnose 4-epimerase